MNYHINTTCIHGDNTSDRFDNKGALSYPIYQTASFTHPAVGQSTGYDYSRLQNPTRQHLEETICALEKGVDCLAFSTGMAAITAMMELFSPGDHIISGSDLYGGSIRLFNNINKKNGIEFDYVDTSCTDIEPLIRPETKAVYIESPSNPMMNVTDIRAISDIAKRHGLLLIVDNTFLSPYFQNPIELGADIVVHSGTKFLGGHNDTLAGFLITASQELSDRLRFIIKTVGSGLAPFDSWLILRGLKTLALRMEQSQKNAIEIARWLHSHPSVTKVYYIGLEDHPGHELSKKQSRGFGGMLTFQVKDKETALRILSNVRLIRFAESLGGTETLITYPYTQTHADMSEEERRRNGITDTTLRLSVGIEDYRDLIEDLNNAF